MAKPDESDKHQAVVEHVAEEMFSSEQREDIWALLIATCILLFSVAFPAQLHHFFSTVLYLF